MVDIWWVVLAFVCGGYTGMLLLGVVAISRHDAGCSELAVPELAAAGAAPGSIDNDENASLG